MVGKELKTFMRNIEVMGFIGGKLEVIKRGTISDESLAKYKLVCGEDGIVRFSELYIKKAKPEVLEGITWDDDDPGDCHEESKE